MISIHAHFVFGHRVLRGRRVYRARVYNKRITILYKKLYRPLRVLKGRPFLLIRKQYRRFISGRRIRKRKRRLIRRRRREKRRRRRARRRIRRSRRRNKKRNRRRRRARRRRFVTSKRRRWGRWGEREPERKRGRGGERGRERGGERERERKRAMRCYVHLTGEEREITRHKISLFTSSINYSFYLNRIRKRRTRRRRYKRLRYKRPVICYRKPGGSWRTIYRLRKKLVTRYHRSTRIVIIKPRKIILKRRIGRRIIRRVINNVTYWYVKPLNPGADPGADPGVQGVGRGPPGLRQS